MKPAAAAEWMTAPGHMVEASAGTGKTTRLVQEFVNAIEAGADVRRVLAVTFTHAAAGDLKLRIRQKLDEAATTSDEEIRNRVRHGIEHLEQAYIGTIHGFCTQCLRQRPVEAGLDPSFIEFSEMESAALFAKVFGRWLETRLAQGSRTLDRAFSRLAYRDEKNQDPVGPLRDAAWKLADWRDFPAPWRKPDGFNRDILRALLVRVADVTADWKGASSNYQYLKWVLRSAAELGDRVRIATATDALDDDNLEAELCYVGRRRYEQSDFTALHNHLPNAYTKWQAVLKDLAVYSRDADADFAAELRDELWEMVLEYDLAKSTAGAVDFQDLLLKTRDLLLNQRARTWFQQQFDHVFVDEFQDTDPLQAEILLLLTASDGTESNWRNVRPGLGKLFLVGDPKQSIYRFRRAEVTLYRQVAEQLTGNGATTTSLSTSHRSVFPIQEFVNSSFATTMEPYLALEGGRAAIPGQPGVVALPIPEIFSPFGKPTKGNIEVSASKTVAGFIEWLLQSSGWRIARKDGTTQLVSENDICILFRRFTADAIRGYVHSLECRGIAHVLIGSKSLHEREEVMTLCAALKSIEHPDDELNLYATLRGALFAIEDADLFLYKQQHRFLTYIDIPVEHDKSATTIIAALRVLADLHKTRNHLPIAATVSRLLERTRAQVGFALRPGGERVLANVNRIIDLARRYEMTTATSFRSFVEYLDDETGTKEAGEAPLLEQEAYGVKLMTVHKAKGLEFPVVILADLTYGNLGEGDRYTDTTKGLCVRRLVGCAPVELLDHQSAESAAERAEADRLAYVAATRASEILVVTALGIGGQEGWLAPFEGALYPPPDQWKHPKKYPAFEGKHTVLNVPAKATGVLSIAPGWHKPIRGEHDVLWFDPSLISEEPPLASGVPTHDLLAGDPGPTFTTYQSWEKQRESARLRGRQAKHRVLAATGGLATTDPSKFAIESVAINPAKREHFTRHFGRLVHQLLQDVDLAASKPQIQTMARAYARSMRRPSLEAAAAADIVATVLTHPLIVSARHATRILREEPLFLRTEDGTIIEGKLDLAYRDSTGWNLVDYKVGRTDRREYERQMRWYATALNASDGLPVRCVLLDIG